MTSKIKDLLKKNFASLAYFYSHLRYRIVLLLATSVLVGFMDGLGLTMFIPLLEMVADQSGEASGEQMGNLVFVVDLVKSLGFQLNLRVVLITILVFFTTKGVFKWLEQYLTIVFQQYFIRKIRIENITDLAQYQYQLFVSADAGRIQNSMSAEVGRVVSAYRNYSQMMQQLVMIITYVSLAFLANPEFAGLVAIGGVMMNFAFKSLYKRTKRLSSDLVRISHSFQGLIIQYVAFFKYLKATGLGKSYVNKLIAEVKDIEHTNKNIGILNSIMMGIREPLIIGVVVVVTLIQITILEGSLGTIMLSILFFYRGLTSVMFLQAMYNTFLSFSGSLVNIQNFTRELSDGREKKGTKLFKGFFNAIELRNVGFSYDSKSILSNINLKINKNETIALVGESGSGKTTLMNMLCGILPASNGDLLIDGTDFKSLNISTLQDRIGYITQEPVVFDDTIFNNVAFWEEKNPENLQRFRDAMRKANILDFCEELEGREESRLGNNGINLSGGQRQRISIARELYKEVDFLFLDEATSALDSETEQIIQQNIELLHGQVTMVVIAHRLSTVKTADRIILVKDGSIDQIGNFEELILESKSFNKMIQMQEF